MKLQRQNVYHTCKQEDTCKQKGVSMSACQHTADFNKAVANYVNNVMWLL